MSISIVFSAAVFKLSNTSMLHLLNAFVAMPLFRGSWSRRRLSNQNCGCPEMTLDADTTQGNEDPSKLSPATISFVFIHHQNLLQLSVCLYNVPECKILFNASIGLDETRTTENNVTQPRQTTTIYPCFLVSSKPSCLTYVRLYRILMTSH